MRARKDAIAKVAKSNQAYKLNILVKQFLFFFFLLRVETILSVSITASGRKNGPTPTGIPIDLASYQQPVHMDPKREAARNAGGCIGLFLYSSGKSTTSAFRWKRWGADCPEWGGESRSSPRMCVVRSLAPFVAKLVRLEFRLSVLEFFSTIVCGRPSIGCHHWQEH